MHSTFRKIENLFFSKKQFLFTFCIVLLLCSILGNAQIKTNEKFGFTITDSLLIKKINYEMSKPNFVFNDHQVRLFKKDFGALLTLYNKFPPEKDKDKTFVAFYIGNLYYYINEDYYRCSEFLYRVFLDENFLNDPQKISLYVILADCENTKSSYINSIFFYNCSLKLAEKNNNYFEVYRANREIGVRFRDLENYNLAKKYLAKAKKLQDQYNIQGEDAIWLLLHYGNLYLKTADYSTARYLLNKALHHPDIKRFPKIKAHIYLEKASLWKKLNNKDSAQANIQKLISETFQNIHKNNFAEKYDKVVLIPAYTILGDIALEEIDSLQAYDSYKKAFLLGKQLKESRKTYSAAKKLLSLNLLDKNLENNVLHFLKENYTLQNRLKNNGILSNKIDEKINTSKTVNNKTEIASLQQKILLIFIPLLVILGVLIYQLYSKVRIIKNKKTKISLLNDNIVETNTKLSKSNQDLDQFSKIVSNDISFSIDSVHHKIKELSAIPNISNQFEKLELEIIKLSTLINQLLLTTKSTKEVNAIPENIDFVEVLETIMVTLKNHIMLMDPQIIYEAKMPLFFGYRIQIYQLLKNMIENALKYSHPARQPIIKINVEKEKDYITLTVSDNGLGIPQAKQKEIFELFSQSRDFDMSKGMGIGLNICKKIVSNYNGSIQLKSEEDNGCTFIMTLQEIQY